MASKKKPMFHAPKKTGELRKIPTSTPVKILSIVSLVILAGLTAFGIYGAVKRNGEIIPLSPGYGMSAVSLLLLLPIVGWIICLGFRLAVRFIPIEMWRLPKSVKDATIETSGKYLKICTLLIELETVLLFWYLTYVLFLNLVPGDVPIVIWVAAVAATVILSGRQALIEAEK